MSTSATTLSAADTASLPLMLSELRLPTIKRLSGVNYPERSTTIILSGAVGR